MAKSFLANRKLLVRLGGQEWGEGTGADIRFLHGPSPDEDSNAVQIRGLEYESIRPEISESRPTIWWSEDRVNKVLVIPGGSDTEGVLTKIASEAAASDLDISIRLVAGPATPASAIPTIDEREENVVLVPRPADIAKEILAADLVVTAGGQSTWEALHLGRPVASYHGSSKEIVGWFSENGFCVDLGPAEEIWPNLLSTLENTALLKQIAQTGYSTIDGKGSQRVAKVIAEAIHSR